MLNSRAKIAVSLFILCGALVQIISSLTWVDMPTENLGRSQATIGEAYFMAGQAIGEFIWLIAIRRFVVKGLLFGEIIIEYLIALIFIDIISVLFLSPFKVELSKYSGFIFATLVYLYRLKIYIKK